MSDDTEKEMRNTAQKEWRDRHYARTSGGLKVKALCGFIYDGEPVAPGAEIEMGNSDARAFVHSNQAEFVKPPAAAKDSKV